MRKEEEEECGTYFRDDDEARPRLASVLENAGEDETDRYLPSPETRL